MVFQVCNSIKMSFYIGFGGGAGLLLQMSWLLNEECGSHYESLGGGRESSWDIKRRAHVFKDS
jgi:hypothetical protein